MKEIRADNIKYQPKDCLVLTSEGICQPCGLGSAAYVLLLGDRGKYAGVLEEAELRELKAAVEKALEVTPKPPKYSVHGHEAWMQTGAIMGSIAHFNNPQLAEEYVAWKNAQGEKAIG